MLYWLSTYWPFFLIQTYLKFDGTFLGSRKLSSCQVAPDMTLKSDRSFVHDVTPFLLQFSLQVLTQEHPGGTDLVVFSITVLCLQDVLAELPR